MIIVTGAAGSLGAAVIKRLAADGLDVAALDIAAAIPDHGQSLSLTGIDLTNGQGAARAVADIAAQGPITGLANIAGGFVWETLGEGSTARAVAGWEAMYRLNVLTAVNASAAALPALRAAKGAVVNIGAAATLKAAAGMGAYSASKSAVMRLSESLAAEEMAHGVRVNAVLPSIIDTPQNRADMPDADFADWVSPEALAEVIAFLLSDKANAVTGASLPVTGKVGW